MDLHQSQDHILDHNYCDGAIFVSFFSLFGAMHLIIFVVNSEHSRERAVWATCGVLKVLIGDYSLLCAHKQWMCV